MSYPFRSLKILLSLRMASLKGLLFSEELELMLVLLVRVLELPAADSRAVDKVNLNINK